MNPNPVPAPASSATRVLFADDEEQFRVGLSRRLQRAGFECQVTASAAGALELLREHEYDVLLADIDMPGNQSLELLEKLPAIAPTLPTVLLTGRPAVETAARSVGFKVAAYLVKPPDFDELCRVLGTAAAGHRDLRVLNDTRARLQRWEQEVASLQRLLQQTAVEGRGNTMRSYLRLTLRNLVVGLVELEQLLNTSDDNSGPGAAIERQELLGALRKTVAVLEKTKGQFKSKDLGDLRRELEDLLHSEEAPPSDR